jgi:hypothetical protein
MASGTVLRNYVALYLQRRRRARAVPDIPAPVITDAEWDFGGTEAGWYDTVLSFSFVAGDLPVATFEVWAAWDGGDFSLLATIPSTATQFRDRAVTQGDDMARSYKLRYVDGYKIGPFSDSFDMGQ